MEGEEHKEVKGAEGKVGESEKKGVDDKYRKADEKYGVE